MKRPALLTCFAATNPGLEPALMAELTALGINAHAEPGGAIFAADLPTLYRINLWLRTADRVLVRVGHLKATEFWHLHKTARRLPWAEFLLPGQPLRFNITAHHCKLHHTVGIAERLTRAIGDTLGQPSEFALTKDDEAENLALLVVRGQDDHFTISIDSSGDLLHRRGYRQALGKAPLRETFAAGLLYFSGFRPEQPFLDAFCGSGTLAIEAAMLARQIAPGLQRGFAFQGWPRFQADQWQMALAEAHAAKQTSAPAPLLASDRDAGAIVAAQANAERAGVAADIIFQVAPFSAIEPPPTPGLWLSNLPYHQRTRASRQDDPRNLFARLGQVARQQTPAWRVAWLVAHTAPLKAAELLFAEPLRLSNGGLKVQLVQAQVPTS